jgi:hypothetical protein
LICIFYSSLSLPPDFGHGLTEIDMYPAIIDEDIVHLEVGLFTVVDIFEFDESILKRLLGFMITYYFTTFDCPESGEDDLKVLVTRHGIKFADKEDILRRSYICVGDVSDHF